MLLKRYPLFLLAVFMSTVFVARAQVVVERTTNKVVISGVPYYLHQVKKGETLYSISRAYMISASEIEKDNPELSQGLKDGQSLKIRVSKVDTEPVSKQVPLPSGPRDEARFHYHVLKQGETVYQLSKIFNVTEQEIIESNPGIDISKLPLGYEIAIPKTNVHIDKPLVTAKTQDKYYHRVERGETMSSIARLYGLSIRELRKANGDTRFPQVGDLLIIPGRKPPPEETHMLVTEEEEGEDIPEIMEYRDKPEGYTTFSNLHGSFNVAIMLPFNLAENAKRSEIDSSKSVKGKKIYREIRRGDDWIYPRSLGFVEMYEGMLLAADTLRSLGLNINLKVFDTGADTNEVKRLIRSGKLDGIDLIVGPVHSGVLTLVAAYAGSHGIPIVSPVQLGNNLVLKDNPTLFMANPTIEVAQSAITEKLKEMYANNIILIHSQLPEEFDQVAKFRNLIREGLSQVSNGNEVRVRNMAFVSRSALGRDSLNRLAYSLSDHNGNVVIIASEDSPVMSESITDIHALARKYSINVFGYPAMRYLDNLDHKICFDLGLLIYSPYWIDYSSADVKQFNSVFRKKFLTEPAEASYAWQGYDIMYYFLSGMAIHGKEFLGHPEIHRPDLLHTEFDFRRRSINDGFENHKLYLIRYSNNYNLELVGENSDSSQ